MAFSYKRNNELTAPILRLVYQFLNPIVFYQILLLTDDIMVLLFNVTSVDVDVTEPVLGDGRDG